MTKKEILPFSFFFILIFHASLIFGQRWSLSNEVFQRNIVLDFKGNLTSQSLVFHDGTGFIDSTGNEFSFEANNQPVNGKSKWSLVREEKNKDSTGTENLLLVLKGNDSVNKLFEVKICYSIYPNLPVCRKKICISYRGNSDVKIESVNVEDLLLLWEPVSATIYNNYGRQKSLGPYTGNWYDAAIAIHHNADEKGIIIGNEAPGVLKRTALFLQGNSLEAGLTKSSQDYPFRKWLKSGESWQSPAVFLALYANASDPFTCFQTVVNEFFNRHLLYRLASMQPKPVFMFDTWNPFRGRLMDTLVRDLSIAARDCGIKEFMIDDGWLTVRGSDSLKKALGGGNKYGDWIIDSIKFSRSLAPVFDTIKRLGMKPGLWIALTAASPYSKVYIDHPEWFALDKNGKPVNLHNDKLKIVNACLATDWYYYIKAVILHYAETYGIKYFKLDLSTVTSANIPDVERSGCYATNHPLHRDWQESLWVLYERCYQLIDELHKKIPDLFIDYTFETAGKLQLIDYSVIQHAEREWISEIESPNPLASLRARQTSWNYSLSIPAGTLLIGTLPLDNGSPELTIKSTAGSFPIFSGDLRKLSAGEKRSIKRLANWLQAMQTKYNFQLFRQELPGFGMPQEGSWDGFARINTETKSGGIIGVFRHGSKEAVRRVTLTGLDPDASYLIRKPSGKKIFRRMKGKKFQEKGFSVKLDKLYDGVLFEIKRR